MTKTQKSYLKDLCLIALFVGLLFSLFLGSRPLVSPDEGRYSEIPRQMLLHHDFVTPRINNIKYFEKPPLFYWLQAGSIKLFGMNEWAFRLATALMGLLGCAITYVAGRELFNRRVGLLASLMLATSSLYFGLARFITLDMTLTTWLTGCLFSFALHEKTKQPRYLWLMYGFAALATLTKGFIGFILPGLIIGIWVLIHGKWRELKHYKLVSGTLLFLAISLPWHLLAQWHNPEFIRYYVLDQQILRYFTHISGRSQPIWFLPLVLIGGLLPWTVWLPQALHGAWVKARTQNQTILSFLLIWPTVVFTLFWFSKSQLSPYILPMFPALLMLIAHHIDDAKLNNKPEWWPLIAFAVFAALICIGCLLKFRSADPALLISLTAIVLSAAVTVLMYWEKGFKAALYTLMASYSVFLLSLNFSLPKYDTRSIKPLIETLKPMRQPNDLVASYHYLYMELPVYLNQNVTLVNYYGELKYGILHGDVSDVWVSNQDFWQHWVHTDQRQFAFMNIKDYRKYNALRKHPLYLLAQTKTNVLVTNQEITP